MFCICGRDSSRFQAFCESRQYWSNVLQYQVGLVKLSGWVVRIGQVFCRRMQDRTYFLRELGRMVKHSVEVGRIGPALCGSGWDWSNFFAVAAHLSLYGLNTLIMSLR